MDLWTLIFLKIPKSYFVLIYEFDEIKKDELALFIYCCKGQ
jgi:hypothetical protein